MRLLNTNTFELDEFFGANIPPYAILSHRWGNGEVTFKDLVEGKGPRKEGWVKIVGCCAQARKDDLKYAVRYCSQILDNKSDSLNQIR